MVKHHKLPAQKMFLFCNFYFFLLLAICFAGLFGYLAIDKIWPNFYVGDFFNFHESEFEWMNFNMLSMCVSCCQVGKGC